MDGVKGLQTEIDISKDVEIKESGEENKEPDAKGTKESEDSDACLKENIKEVSIFYRSIRNNNTVLVII